MEKPKNTPFNYRRQQEQGKLSDRIKGKNVVDDDQHATELVEQLEGLRTTLQEATGRMIVDRLTTSDGEPVLDDRSIYPETDPATPYRKDLCAFLNIALKDLRPLEESGLSEIYKRRIEQLLQQALDMSESSVFRVSDKSISDLVTTDQPELELPYIVVSGLWEQLRDRFDYTFHTHINLFDLTLKRLDLTTDGAITTAIFQLEPAPADLSATFRDRLPTADHYELMYSFAHDSLTTENDHDHMTVRAIDSAGHCIAEVELESGDNR